MALAVLTSSLLVTVMLYRALEEGERAVKQRHCDTLASAIRDEVISRTGQQMLGQVRMAGRLGDGLFTNEAEAQWRSDARRYQAHHPYYRAVAVIDTELRIRWLEASGPIAIEAGMPYPADPGYRQILLDNSRGDGPVVARPVMLPDAKPGISFYTPVFAAERHLGYLVAVLVVPEAFAAMQPPPYAAEVQVRVSSRGLPMYPVPSEPFDLSSGISSKRRLDADDDEGGFDMEVALRPATAARLSSGLPLTVLGTGTALSALLALAGLLWSDSARHARALAHSNQRLRSEIDEREQAQQQLHYLATHDSLTTLPNRTATQQALQQKLQQRDQERGVLAVLFLDLDQFKDINDSLGHQIGDQLLEQVPRRLHGVMRQEDFLGRQGGDEFLLIVERADAAEVRQLAEGMLKILDASFAVEHHHLFVSASIGVALHPEAGENASDLVRNADTALFKAKGSGRNQYQLFSRELLAEVQHRVHLSRDLRHALDRHEFSLVYQPIVRLEDAELAGVEALLRWNRSDGREIATQDFIRVAEETGLIGRLGEMALRLALRDYAGWARGGGPMPWLAVNISGAQIRQASFPAHLAGLLEEFEITPSKLHLEITEDVLIENLARNCKILEDLDRIGLRICVDDFGVGYSSLAYLKNFPVSVVKIDRGFIRDLARDREDQAITRTICTLALELGMDTVAEGIEEPAQRDLLRQYGCGYVQGFLYSRPLPASGIEHLLAGHRPWVEGEGRLV
jgi:diguanylate cyclase (GGDEF)-like protein